MVEKSAFIEYGAVYVWKYHNLEYPARWDSQWFRNLTQLNSLCAPVHNKQTLQNHTITDAILKSPTLIVPVIMKVS